MSPAGAGRLDSVRSHGTAEREERGTAWRTDTGRGLTGILLTQRMVTSPEPVPLVTDFWAAAYAAIGVA